MDRRADYHVARPLIGMLRLRGPPPAEDGAFPAVVPIVEEGLMTVRTE